MHKIIFFAENLKQILGFTSNFRYGQVTLNKGIFYLALGSRLPLMLSLLILYVQVNNSTVLFVSGDALQPSKQYSFLYVSGDTLRPSQQYFSFIC